MELINTTPFLFAPIVGKVNFPSHSLTLVVKGIFDLLPNALVKAADKQVFPTGDEFYPGDDEFKGSVRYDSDFAHWKPKADLLLVGKCYAPDCTPVSQSRVTFRVGVISRSLSVFGNRYWTRSFGVLWQPSPPKPFTEMSLAYENSFGGEGFKDNPVGKGYGKEEDQGGSESRPLPNIEDPQHPIESKSNRPYPVGFGPLSKSWPQRKSKLGTYKKQWLKERWPWFPEDFDWSYYNAAPSGMQMEGYLKGDEKLFFENLHPKHAQYHSQLPGLRMRCFLDESEAGGKERVIFRELPLNLDTLWVDMEAEKLVLVWRGVANVKSEDSEEIQRVFIISESMSETPRSKEFYEDFFRKKLADLTSDEEEIKIEEPEVEDETDSVDEEIAKAEVQMREALIAAGIDPDNPPPQSEDAKAKEAKILKQLDIDDDQEEPSWTRERFQEHKTRGESFGEKDLSGIDLSGLDLKGIDFQKAILAGANFMNADLSGANFTRANLAGSNLSGANLTKAVLKEADLTEANLTNSNLAGALLDDAIVVKAQMQNAILDHAIAKDANFSESDMTKASLRGAKLAGADFSKSKLNQTSFQSANLFQASFGGAVGIEVSMEEADLKELRATSGVNFSKGVFRKATGAESIWQKADLSGADFSFADMRGADFSSASLERANLYATSMKGAKFRKANLTEAKFVCMNLFQGSLEKANLTRADFRGSNLYGVEFLEAVLEDANFELANLKMTKLAK